MADLLARFPVLNEALPEALARPIAPYASLIRGRAGQTLTAIGSGSNNVYIVLEGRVQVTVFSFGGREVILRDLGRGTLFGELAALDDQPRSASIVALTATLLACFPGGLFRAAVSESPEAALWMMRRLTKQVRELTEKIFELNTLRVAARLHCELLRLCETVAADGRTAVIDPFPTHAELASRIGTHREAVTREMRFLAGQNILSQERRRTTVTDVQALAGLVREASGEIGEISLPYEMTATQR